MRHATAPSSCPQPRRFRGSPWRRALAAVVTLLLCAIPHRAAALRLGKTTQLYGYAQVWATIIEEFEDGKGLLQHSTRDEAATSTTGFRLARARIGLRQSLAADRLRFELQVKLERSPALLDVFMDYRPTSWFTVRLGQHKVPGPAENLTSARRLPFVLRGVGAAALADYSLSRTIHASSYFIGNRSLLRDLGLSLLLRLPAFGGEVKAQLMAANGLGANLYFGVTGREFLLSNPPQLFYGARVEGRRLFGFLSMGGHATWNKHDNMVLNSGRVVHDLDRLSWSADLGLEVQELGLSLTGLFSGGRVDDDYDVDGKIDLLYRGWAAHLLWSMRPLLRLFFGPLRLPLDLAARLERYSREVNESDVVIHHDELTVGLNLRPLGALRLQLNYVFRRTTDPARPDLKDNLFVLNVQISF